MEQNLRNDMAVAKLSHFNKYYEDKLLEKIPGLLGFGQSIFMLNVKPTFILPEPCSKWDREKRKPEDKRDNCYIDHFMYEDLKIGGDLIWSCFATWIDEQEFQSPPPTLKELLAENFSMDVLNGGIAGVEIP